MGRKGRRWSSGRGRGQEAGFRQASFTTRFLRVLGVGMVGDLCTRCCKSKPSKISKNSTAGISSLLHPIWGVRSKYLSLQRGINKLHLDCLGQPHSFFFF